MLSPILSLLNILLCKVAKGVSSATAQISTGLGDVTNGAASALQGAGGMLTPTLEGVAGTVKSLPKTANLLVEQVAHIAKHIAGQGSNSHSNH